MPDRDGLRIEPAGEVPPFAKELPVDRFRPADPSPFNGKDLSGFYTFTRLPSVIEDPNKVFTVHDGMIQVSGEEYRRPRDPRVVFATIT